jgi:hypothetical protein
VTGTSTGAKFGIRTETDATVSGNGGYSDVIRTHWVDETNRVRPGSGALGPQRVKRGRTVKLAGRSRRYHQVNSTTGRLSPEPEPVDRAGTGGNPRQSTNSGNVAPVQGVVRTTFTAKGSAPSGVVLTRRAGEAGRYPRRSTLSEIS